MKRLYVALALMIAGCGTPAPRAPDWQSAANAALADYIKQRLEGHTAAAARAYTLAQERMRDGGDLDGLHTVWLTRCAMDVALLLPADCGEFLQRIHGARAEARAYHALLTGSLAAGDIAVLPERYRPFAAALAANANAAPAVLAITDPVSRVIASGVVARVQRVDEALLAAAISTARAQGWRAAHRAQETARVTLLETQGRAKEAAALRARLDTLYGLTAP